MSLKSKELLEKSQALKADVVAVFENDEATGEERNGAREKLKEAVALIATAKEMRELEAAVAEFKAGDNGAEEKAHPQTKSGFSSLGQYLLSVYRTRPDLIHRTIASGNLHPGLLSRKADPDEAEIPQPESVDWIHKKDAVPQAAKQMVENVGASGGFLVPVEFRPELLQWAWEDNPIRARATVIPMRRRQLQVPTLDHTGTAAGATRQYGGVVASWTEEATQKDETEPEFRQINLVAHKLVCYTESSDELLADEAIGLVALLTRLFGGAIAWEEEWTFLRGTGAGQPLGVINAGATFVEPRAVAGTIGIDDIIQMIGHHQGSSPIWHITRAAFPTIAQLNGPAGNPSYVFIPNAREGIPATLFGFPIFWTEKLPTLGTQGDILLASWDMYLVGDRQQVTIDTTNIFRFRNDLTSWRAVHRVDGQPWLTQPVTLADGAWQISPFVILGDVAT
jgi:HK97 family phage major capsid protein